MRRLKVSELDSDFQRAHQHSLLWRQEFNFGGEPISSQRHSYSPPIPTSYSVMLTQFHKNISLKFSPAIVLTSALASANANQPPVTMESLLGQEAMPPALMAALESIENLLSICDAPGLSFGCIHNGAIFTKSFGLRGSDPAILISTPSQPSR
jgi:hypothetical protein